MAEMANTAPNLTEKDIERLKAKYQEERDKRVRPDRRMQYQVLMTGDSDLLKDPFAEPFEREPLSDEVDVILIGGGFSGLVAGARLRELGVEKIRIIDKAGDVGGTWYWNRYPGLRCDIESYIYMPLLEETGYMPTQKFADQAEIFEHAQRIAKQYDLYKDACFQTEVTKVEWDENDEKWIVHTSRGDRMRARFVFNGPGPMHIPHLPKFEGLEDFKGRSFLTCRWDFDYTKGDCHGGLTGLRDKKVAIIGTGATSIQAVPILAEYCKHLYVVQRTPSAMGPRPSPPTDPEWAKSLKPGWQKERMFNFAAICSRTRQDKNLVDDVMARYWEEVNALTPKNATPEEAEKALEQVDFKTQEARRKYVEDCVDDPELAESLKAYYRFFCKRPTFSDTYYQAFNRPNVTLVDTKGRGLSHITEKGFVFDGQEYEVDCIIFSTGFEIDPDFHHRAGFDIIGRNGLSLQEKWKNGPRTFQACFTHGFPNFFNIFAVHGGFYLNVVNRIEQDVDHLMFILKHMFEAGKTVVEATQEGEDYWMDEFNERASNMHDFLAACTPGQYNNEGNPNGLNYMNTGWGDGIVAWENVLREWREAGTFKGLKFT